MNVIAFANAAVAALLALSDGDSVAMCGEATPKTYVAKDGVRSLKRALAFRVGDGHD